MRYAAGAMVGWYGAQVPGAVRQALKRYKKFKRVKPYDDRFEVQIGEMKALDF